MQEPAGERELKLRDVLVFQAPFKRSQRNVYIDAFLDGIVCLYFSTDHVDRGKRILDN